MNRVVLVGRLTRDPELRSTQTGKSVCNFGIAVDRRIRRDAQQQSQQTADFFNIVAWNRQAEVICQYMHKGSQIALEGRLQQRKYQAQDGSNRNVVEVVLETFDFIGSRNNGQNSQNGYDQPDDIFDEDFSLIADNDDVPF